MKKNAVGKLSKALTPTRTALRQGVDRAPRMPALAVVNEPALLSDLRNLIQSGRQRIAQQYKPVVGGILHSGFRVTDRASRCASSR